MQTTKLAFFCGVALLACSGRYESNQHDAQATGGSGNNGSAGQGAAPGQGAAQGVAASSNAGTASSTGGDGTVILLPPLVDDRACGVAKGQPAALPDSINNDMLWWTRVSRLVWGAQQHEPPVPLKGSINHNESGALVDAALDQAIAETGGLPGVELFLRSWLQLGGPPLDAPQPDPNADAAPATFMVDWSAVLSGTAPAPEFLLTLDFDRTRRGAFSEPAFLIAHANISSRGTTMVEGLFGVFVPRKPPGGTPFTPPAGVTRRAGLAQSVQSSVCAGCHNLIDPLGFAFENFDALGEYNLLDAGQPVDTSGSYRPPNSEMELSFNSFRDLAPQLAERCDVNLGFSDQFLLFALEQSAIQTPSLDAFAVDRARMQQAFMRGTRSYRDLVKAFAQGPAIRAN